MFGQVMGTVVGFLTTDTGTRRDNTPEPAWAVYTMAVVVISLGVLLFCNGMGIGRFTRAVDEWFVGKERADRWYGEEGSRRARWRSCGLGGFFIVMGFLIALVTPIA